MEIFTTAFLEEVLTVPCLEAINSFTSDELCKFHWESRDLNFRSTNVIRLGKFYLKSLVKATLCTESHCPWTCKAWVWILTIATY